MRQPGAQVRHQAGADPPRRFVELLSAAIASGRAHLAAPDGAQPEPEGAWGWRRNGRGEWEPKGERVGWVDEGQVYLQSDAAYAVVERLGQEVGDALGLSPHTLRRRLKERGLLATTDPKRQSLSVRRVLEGRRREVLHIHAASLSSAHQPEQGELPVEE